MNRKMTCLALGLKFGSRSIHGLVAAVVAATEPGLAASSASACARDSPIMLAKLIMANPPPILRRASRRVTGFGF